MSNRIKNLADAGYITKTGLVGNETAEAWSIDDMLENQTITKTGLDKQELTKTANGKVDAPTFIYDDVNDKLTINGGKSKPIIYYKADGGAETKYIAVIDVTNIDEVEAWATKDDYLDSDKVTWTKPAGE